MSQDVGISRATLGETKTCEDINKSQTEGGRKQDWTRTSRSGTHKAGGTLYGEGSLSGAPRFRRVVAGCLLHAKIMHGLWRGDPSEPTSACVDLRPCAGQVSLPFGCICYTESIGIYLVLKDIFTARPQFS